MTSTVIRQAAPTKISAHVGAVGDRLAIEGVISKIIDGYGNGGTLYVIHDVDGNEFVVRWTRYQAPAKNVRALVNFEATVLRHSDFRGVKRTEVSPGQASKVSDAHWALRG